jgi:hypothetical protein
MQNAAKKKHQEGRYLSKVKSYLSILPYDARIKHQPIKVIKFGAIFLGISLTSHSQK